MQSSREIDSYAGRASAFSGTGRYVLLLLLPFLPYSGSGHAEEVTPEAVRAALEGGKQALIKNLRVYLGSYEPGYSILAVMGLLNSGVSPQHPTLVQAIGHLKTSVQNSTTIKSAQYIGVYRSGLMLMMLAMINDPGNKALASELSHFLKLVQDVNGGWGDFSRTQFALLGLKAAEDMGVSIPDSVYRNAKRYVLAGQNADGGWGYQPGRGTSYGSMTVAGLSSLYICGARLYKGTSVCGRGASDPDLARGTQWLSDRFTVRTNPRLDRYHFYYLYGLERIGVLLAQRTIGGHDWYREGAAYLVRTQDANGSWTGNLLDTEFAMLFLGKGSQPVAIQKLRYNGDWNPDPYDIKNLVERASKDLSTPMTFQTVESTATASALAVAPILYLQGKNGFEFDARFRKALRAFVDQGGFVMASSCCGNTDFTEAFKREMKRLFPESDFEKLSGQHPVYDSRHKITQQDTFMLEGMNTGCRTSILLAPHDVCCAWGDCKGCKDNQCVHGEESFKLGVNMIAYALDFQRLRDKLENAEVLERAEKESPPRGSLIIGQLYHEGDWNPDPASIENLTKTLKAEAGVKSKIFKHRVVLGADDPGDYPVLYLTGHKPFEFSDIQIRILRTYLNNGGFLLADPCCGRPAFDAAFRSLCGKLYPDEKLEPLGTDHRVFRTPYEIERVEYKPWARRFFPDLKNEPRLEAIHHQGRIAVLYSRFNFGCELQGHSCSNCIGLEGKDAYRIAVNALLYALSH